MDYVNKDPKVLSEVLTEKHKLLEKLMNNNKLVAGNKPWQDSPHQCSLIRKLTYRVNGLKRIGRNSTFQPKLMIAYGAIMSKMVYLITVWGGATQYLLKAVQTLQLIAARAVCCLQSSRWSRRKGWTRCQSGS